MPHELQSGPIITMEFGGIPSTTQMQSLGPG